MTKFFCGIGRALYSIEQMKVSEMLEHVDALLGRERLRPGYTVQELRLECYRQTQIDFLDSRDPDYRRNLAVLQGGPGRIGK